MLKTLAVSFRSIKEISAAVAVTLLTTWVLLALRSEENTAMISQLYLLPVGISAARWGWRGGISGALASFLAFNYFFLKPHYTFSVHRSQDVITLVTFLAVGAVISQLISRSRRSQAAAEERQRETQRLYELNNLLIGMNDPKKILSVLAEQTLNAFQALRVEIFLEPRLGNGLGLEYPASQLVCAENMLPEQELSLKPTLLIPLESSSNLGGEVRIWLNSTRAGTVEERSIQAFMLRGMIALERTRVAASEQQARTLAESDRLKSALLSSVSHELRTPLATIKAAVTSLVGGYDLDPEVQSDLLAAIEEETDHLNQLVSNLLSMSRLEAGALQLQKRWNSLREILDGVLQRMRPTTHRIDIQVSAELPLLPVDYVLIEQVFINLLSNCVKYAPEDSVIIIRSQAKEDQTLLIQFVNQGPPVAEEHLEHIFDKFYRITAAEKISGIGLGLSICKGIVEIHGGKIWAENSPQGFTFNVSLPLTWQGEQPFLPNA